MKPGDCWPCPYWQNLRFSSPGTDGAARVRGAKSQNTPHCLSSLLFSSNLLHFLPCSVLQLVRQLPESSSPSRPRPRHTHVHTQHTHTEWTLRSPGNTAWENSRKLLNSPVISQQVKELQKHCIRKSLPIKKPGTESLGHFANCFLPKQQTCVWHWHRSEFFHFRQRRSPLTHSSPGPGWVLVPQPLPWAQLWVDAKSNNKRMSVPNSRVEAPRNRQRI